MLSIARRIANPAERGNANNNSGFGGLPGIGRYHFNGEFDPASGNGYWWTSTEEWGGVARSVALGNSYEGVSRGSDGKTSGISVRCIKD